MVLMIIVTVKVPELENILSEAGFSNYKFYYPEPDYKLPEVIFSDDRLPNPGEIRNYRKDYCSPRQYLFNEAIVEDQICRDRKYDYFANSYLIECTEEASKMVYIKYNDNRRKEYRNVTMIEKEDERYRVLKRGANIDLIENNSKCQSVANIEIIHGEAKGEFVSYKFIAGDSLECIIYKHRNDIDKIYNDISRFFDLYFKANQNSIIDFCCTAEYIRWFGDDYINQSKSLRITNIDLLASNIICQEEKYYVIDDEWIFNFPIPLYYPLFRCVYQIYSTFKPYLMNTISDMDFIKMFNINDEEIKTYKKMERNFAARVMAKDYRINYRTPALTLNNKIII